MQEPSEPSTNSKIRSPELLEGACCATIPWPCAQWITARVAQIILWALSCSCVCLIICLYIYRYSYSYRCICVYIYTCMYVWLRMYAFTHLDQCTRVQDMRVCVCTSAQLEVHCGMISEICIDCVATYFRAYLGKLSDPASRAYAVYGLRFRVWGS